MRKSLPFAKTRIEKIVRSFPTPFHLYDEKGIRKTALRFKKAFSQFSGFRNFFAVKALPNPSIMKILYDEGMGMDASSLAELLLCERVGIRGENIMFSSNNTALEEYKKARELGAIINLDDINHIPLLEQITDLPDVISFRYNPGPRRKGGRQTFIMGKPEEAKFGVTKKQLLQGYQLMKSKEVKRFGIHTMIASNELDHRYFLETARMLFDVVIELSHAVGITFEFVNLGGGIGIPYKPTDKPFNLEKFTAELKKLYERRILGAGHPPLKIFTENGRAVTGPHGYLVSKVLHVKKTYRTFAGLDSSMSNLMRPGMYGAYHHITVLGKENRPAKVYDVVGSLCEGNDKFAIKRRLPAVSTGDIVVIHDTGAHGHTMGFNYNGKLRSAEILLQKDGEPRLIRRAETVDDLFKTFV